MLPGEHHPVHALQVFTDEYARPMHSPFTRANAAPHRLEKCQ